MRATHRRYESFGTGAAAFSSGGGFGAAARTAGLKPGRLPATLCPAGIPATLASPVPFVVSVVAGLVMRGSDPASENGAKRSNGFCGGIEAASASMCTAAKFASDVGGPCGGYGYG